MTNVLLTSASRKVSLIRAFQEAAREGDGGHVIAVDASPQAAGLYLADRGEVVPRMDHPEFRERLLALCERESVDLIVPTRDEELPFFARERSAFEAVDATVLVPRQETVETCRDKRRFARFCEAHDLETPSLQDPADPGPFPLFVKPRIGKGSRHTYRVDDERELEAALTLVGEDPVLQAYVDAPEYTIDFFADLSGEPISVVPRQRLKVFGGESFVGRTVREPVLQEGAVALARDLGLVGHNTIQCFLDAGRASFIEVNPRYGGGAALGFAAGAPTPRYLLRLLRGEPVAPRLGAFQEGLYMLRYTEDVFLPRDDLLQG